MPLDEDLDAIPLIPEPTEHVAYFLGGGLLVVIIAVVLAGSF